MDCGSFSQEKNTANTKNENIKDEDFMR